VVETIYSSSSSRLDIDAHIFINLFQDLTNAIALVVGNVTVDSKVIAMTSSILRIYRLSLSKVFIKVGLRVYS
jgi:hypothetical protein